MTGKKETVFHKTARKKGWLLIEIGERWGVGERQMSRIANNPSQKDLDAVQGLPPKKGAETLSRTATFNLNK